MQREKVTSGLGCMELTVNMKLALSQPLPQLGAPYSTWDSPAAGPPLTLDLLKPSRLCPAPPLVYLVSQTASKAMEICV